MYQHTVCDMQPASASYATSSIASDCDDDEGGESEGVVRQKSGTEEEGLVRIKMSPVQVDAVSMDLQQGVSGEYN